MKERSSSKRVGKANWWLLATLITMVLCIRGSLVSWPLQAQASKPSPRKGTPLSHRRYRRLSRKLVKLRTSVDRLTAQIRLERTQHLLALRGLESRRSQLQLLVDQERLRVQRLLSQRKQLQEKLKDRKRSQQDIRAALEHALQSVRRGILNSLPYRRTERMALINRIDSRLKARRIDAEQGVAALWRILEDELRLTTIVERAEIPLILRKGQLPRLVKIVRIGMIALFVRESKESFGRMVRDSKGKWRYFPVKDPKYTEQIDRLFRNVERQLREGRYLLPLFAPR